MFIEMKEIIESTHRVLLLHFSSWLSGMKYWEKNSAFQWVKVKSSNYVL